jgi:hypothetical protein
MIKLADPDHTAATGPAGMTMSGESGPGGDLAVTRTCQVRIATTATR